MHGDSPDSGPRYISHRPYFSYHLYGVNLRSQWKLPHPQTVCESSPIIHLAEGSPILFEGLYQDGGSENRKWFYYKRLADGRHYLRVPGVYEVLVSEDGRRVQGRLLRELSDHTLMHLVHAAASFGLIQLGIEHLHATAVTARDKAFAFLGRSGYGKSSLASVFLDSGYSILTDDMLALKSHGDDVCALPGPPQLKLFNDAADNVFLERGAEVSLNPLSQKLVFPLKGPSPELPVPLKGLYILRRPRSDTRDSRIIFKRLSPRTAVMTLVQSSFHLAQSDPNRLALQLHAYTRIAARVPMKSLSYPRRFDLLPAVRDALLEDFART